LVGDTFQATGFKPQRGNENFIMSKRKKVIVNCSLIFVAITPIVLYAYEYGPDPGYSGAPGDNATACEASGCHVGKLNPTNGSVKIVASGGTTYVPGQMQTIMVTVTDATEKRYGFEFSPRVDSNPKVMGAGTLKSADALTDVIDCKLAGYTPFAGSCPAGNTLQWITHNLTGYTASNSTPGSYTYKFNWTPPATNVGTITLYSAGNAVTGALVTTGANTYTTKLTLSPSTGGSPTPTVTAVVNGASSGSSIATGSWVSIYGSNLATDSRLWNPSTEIINGIFPTSLDGTSVTINNKMATVEYISPGQVNIQPPDDTAVGPVPVVVTTAAGASSTFMATYAQIAPGLFPGAAAPYIVAQHADNSYVTPASPAQPGEVIILWGTGFGPASPAVPAGKVFNGANPLANTATATIGGQSAPIDFAGVVGAGLVQINVHVPNISNGDAPVVVTVGGASTQSTSNMIPVHN
jgi:uncharacterized protein (TIGR03437 family)